jgi:hypothetical protein
MTEFYIMGTSFIGTFMLAYWGTTFLIKLWG